MAGHGEGGDGPCRRRRLLRPCRAEEVRRGSRNVEGTGLIDPTPFDRDVRLTIAECIRERGAVPSVGEVAERVVAPEADVAASFARLGAARALILQPGTNDILSFNPFAAGPTDFRVRAGGRDWWALCAWDAFGVA